MNDLEYSILGTCMISSAALERTMAVLDNSHFSDKFTKNAFDAMRRLHIQGRAVDVSTMKESLKDKELVNLLTIGREATSAHIDSYIDLLVERKTRQNISKLMTNTIDSLFTAPLEEIYTNIEKMATVANSSGCKGVSMAEANYETIQLEYSAYRKFGIKGPDNIAGGVHKDQYYIIGARPSVGKTTLALQSAYNMAINYPDEIVLFYSLEMPVKMLNIKTISRVASVDSQKMLANICDGKELQSIELAQQEIADKASNLIMFYEPDITLGTFLYSVMHYAMKYKICAVYLDYLGLVNHSLPYKKRHDEIAEISRALKRLPGKIGAPVIALHQLTRESTKQEEPTLESLRDSGSLEQDADAVAFLFSSTGERDRLIDEIVFKIEKNRHGRIGRQHMKYFKEYNWFTETI